MPKKKPAITTYRIRNWSDYDKALVNRGSLTIWFEDDSVKAWINHEKTGKRGVPQPYTDADILYMLTLMAVYSLRLRSTQGLLHAFFRFAMIDLLLAPVALCEVMQDYAGKFSTVKKKSEK
ncbi:MAG: transposase [Pyrinomonadaceae bacterium]|jgi:hypothetical protein|nr:transposase [Pyrinomonadaceae bacterium]